MPTPINIAKTLVLVSVLTVIDHIALTNIDSLMESHIIGYQARASYLLSNTMYFSACFITILCGLALGWSRMLPFIYIAVAVFFPMIFLTSCWEVYFEMNAADKTYYQENLCVPSTSSDEFLCGKALAHIVFSRVISALPLLFLTPILFYITIRLGYFGLPMRGKKADG